MKKVLGFSGSNNSNSINQQLVAAAGSLLSGSQFHLIELRKYDQPVFSSDLQKEKGIPDKIRELHATILEHDAFIISLPEYNWSVTGLFKNTIDWLSVVEKNYKIFGNKPVLLLSATPGRGGGKVAMEHGEKIIHAMGGKVTRKFSFPSFHHHMKGETEEMKNSKDKLMDELKIAVNEFTLALNGPQ